MRIDRHRAVCNTALQLQREELAASNQVLGRTHDALADALAEQGDAHAAAGHARGAAEAVLAAYGEGSLAAAHQRQKLSAVLHACGRRAEAEHVAALAAGTLRVCKVAYGDM